MKNEDVKETTQEVAATEPASPTKTELDKLIRHHVYASMGMGLIPFPIIDFAGITTVQLNMLRVIAKKFDVPFSKDIVKNILSSLVGGAVPVAAATPLALSLSKLIPGIGLTAGVVTMPIVAGASTYAVGKVFIQHFASGGTFLTFDPEKVKAYYASMFKEGQKVATSLK